MNTNNRIKTHLKKLVNKIKLHSIDFGYSDAVNPSITEDLVLKYNNERTNGPDRIICKAPFNSIYFDPYGNITSCCFNRTYHLGNIANNTIEEIWFGDKLKIFQNEIKNYNLSMGCNECQRHLLSQDFNHFGGQHYDNSSIQTFPTRFSFELSNVCNLECVMCSGRFSNLIRKNREKLPPIKNAYRPDFIQQVAFFSDKLEFVNFLGGEPTMIKLNLDIMEMLIHKSKRCKLHVTTNATNIGDRFKKILASGRFEISISLDSIYKETYEEIRKNALFEETLANIKYYVDLRKSNKIKLMFTACPMISNWREIPEVIKFVDEQDCRIFLNHVINPPKLSLAYLSAEKLQEIMDELGSINLQLNGKESQYNMDAFNSFVKRINGYREDAILRATFFMKYEGKSVDSLKEEIKERLFSYFPNENNHVIIDQIIGVMSNYSSDKNRFLHYLYDIQAENIVMVDYLNTDDFIQNFEQHFSYGYDFEVK